MKHIYLDNAASTPLSPLVKSKITQYIDESTGNPSAIHSHGRFLKSKIEGARKSIASILNCSIGEIFFTSGGTESNNTIINNVVRHKGIKRIITTRLEHPSVYNTIAALESESVEVIFLDTDKQGQINLKELEDLLSNQTNNTLVSIMHANNEVGTIYPIQQIGELCKLHKVLFHTDATQTVGHLDLDLQELHVDYLTASGHKFHSLKGTGIMFVSSYSQIPAWIIGGAQERNMRAGTENYTGILSIADALEEMTANLKSNLATVEALRASLKTKLQEISPNCIFNGCQHHYLSTILNVGFPKNSHTDMLVPLLDIEGIAVSGGSACSSGSEKPSRVLECLNPNSQHKAIRFSFSHYNTPEEINSVALKLKNILNR